MIAQAAPAKGGVSIHAPTRGATLLMRGKAGQGKFQSTLPRGERRCFRLFHRFNRLVSIHAPTRGATPFRPLLSGQPHVSIHAPTRGATNDA